MNSIQPETYGTLSDVRQRRPLARLLGPLVDGRTYAALVFFVGQIVLASIAFALLVGGWTVTLVLAITPFVVPLLVGLRLAVGGLAHAEARMARALLGVEVRTPVSTPATGFWSRGLRVLRDGAFWKQQAYLLLAWPLALLALAPVWWALELITVPVWAGWAEGYEVWHLWDVDSVAEGLPFSALGVVVLAVSLYLLALHARLARWLVARLLSGEARPVRSREEARALRFQALTVTAIVATAIALVLVLVWELTTPDGYFWPIWPLLALSLVVGVPGWIVAVLENDVIRRAALGSRALAIQVGASGILLGFPVAVWAITTGGYFWPAWPALGLTLLALAHAAVIYARRVHRVEQLEESRAAAVDVQETELRRIERDLHDGAQARLVALGMSLGMAEEKLRTDPEGAQALLAEARSGARAALVELRDLARGIRPPILTDRGLGPAVEALAAVAPVSVEVSVELPERPPAAVETAAYFVVAEALANAIKYADASAIEMRIRGSRDRLEVEVVDDGKGGADPRGNGLGGLEQRVRALEGAFSVTSPPGGPTAVRAELPCA